MTAIQIDTTQPPQATEGGIVPSSRRLADLPDLLTVDELSAFLQIPKKTLYQWRTNGSDGPPAQTIGRHLRYPKEQLLEWLRSKKLAA